jgi:hypothetical protein
MGIGLLCRLLTSVQSPEELPPLALSVSISFARNHRWPRLRPGLIDQEPDWSLIDRSLSRSDTSDGGTLLKYLDEVAIGCQTA